MRLHFVAFALVSAMLVLPATASASDLHFHPLDYLYNWPSECGEERYWFGTVEWEGHCVEGVGIFTPGLAGEGGTKPIVICVTCDADLLP